MSVLYRTDAYPTYRHGTFCFKVISVRLVTFTSYANAIYQVIGKETLANYVLKKRLRFEVTSGSRIELEPPGCETSALGLKCSIKLLG